MMKKLITTVSVFLLCAVMSVPAIDARGCNDRNDRGSKPAHSATTSRPSRPSQSSRPERPGNSGNGNNRPDNRPNNRPGNNRPENRPNNRPGNNRPDNRPNNRPGNNRPSQPPRPGNGNHNHGHNHNHGWNRPTPPPAHHWGHNHGHHRPPPRPYLPPYRPYRRPVPPPRYVPVHGLPVFSTILNVAIGTALNASVNYWMSNGYNVRGYDNDYVSLADVMQMGYMWPDATLYFDDGRLVGSEFVYSTYNYNRSRYNNLSVRLMQNYGAPVSTDLLPGGGERTSWWGAGGQYVTLSYYAATAVNGSTRYYTTLSFGN